MPPMPAAEEWDRDSTLREGTTAPRPRIGNNPQELATLKKAKAREKSLAKQNRALDDLLQSNRPITDFDLPELKALACRLQEGGSLQISQDMITILLDSLDGLERDYAVYASCICLIAGARSELLRPKVSAKIPDLWNTIAVIAPTSELAAIAALSLDALHTFMRDVYVEETWLVSLSSRCIKLIRNFKLDDSLVFSLVQTLVVAASKSTTVSRHIYEEICILPLIRMCRLQFKWVLGSPLAGHPALSSSNFTLRSKHWTPICPMLGKRSSTASAPLTSSFYNLRLEWRSKPNCCQ